MKAAIWPAKANRQPASSTYAGAFRIAELVRTDVDRRDDRLPGQLPSPRGPCRPDRGPVAASVAEHAGRGEAPRGRPRCDGELEGLQPRLPVTAQRASPAPRPPLNRIEEERASRLSSSPGGSELASLTSTRSSGSSGDRRPARPWLTVGRKPSALPPNGNRPRRGNAGARSPTSSSRTTNRARVASRNCRSARSPNHENSAAQDCSCRTRVSRPSISKAHASRIRVQLLVCR